MCRRVDATVVLSQGDLTVPARRSRTQHWRRCLDELCARGGSLEIAVASTDGQDAPRDLVWRVRLLALEGGALVIEQPSTLGSPVPLENGIELIVVLAIGQNRWMFRSTVMGSTTMDVRRRQDVSAFRITMPTDVERCQRRSFYRVETAQLHLPEVELWPLLDPKSVVLAERANEAQTERRFAQMNMHESAGVIDDDEFLMPEVGPGFSAQLVNLGGGGLGLDVKPDDTSTLNRHKLYWLKFALPPAVPTPICATAKLVHTHVQSTQHVYGGMAFDFSFNPGHQRFVVEQICRYIAVQQRAQMQRKSA